MRGTLPAVGLAPGKPRAAVGLTAGLPPVWMLHGVCGKTIVKRFDATEEEVATARAVQLKPHVGLARSGVEGSSTK